MNEFGGLLTIILVVFVIAIVQRVKRAARAAKRGRDSWSSPRATSTAPSSPSTQENVEVADWVAPVTTQPFDPDDDVEVEEPPVVIEGPAYVVDGDTVVVRKTQIRLYGIDAPEMNHPFGKKAKWALIRMCKGQSVQAEILSQDAHGRTVARCHLPDGRDLSAEMVKQGLAIDWPKFSGGVYSKFEIPNARKKMWLADARQKGRMHVWEAFENRQAEKGVKNS
ncbi:thermonuclease family protein [Antarctobacter heliothermus]|uniref:Endonuclease YncB, thermonuclease family n=1 Tax=Antarctobacter heliothermus TaxID=74033 RepID=A0A239F4E0_9RHOB|nr:thermonuclease family protein [Antarctobacter heliothermus]SNS51900.1 Endonuclease YncB, thermonuclease family [Antarctobacter heliothermus]